MNKVIKYSIFLALLISLSTAAQNTASISGNWDDCTTWGTPATLFNNTTDTKTINTSVNVTQNTAWSTNNVNFGTGNGSISFADNAKSIDFVTDAGNDKTCVCPTAPVVTNITPSLSDPTACCWTSGYSSFKFGLSGSNLGTTTWTLSPASGASITSGTATGSATAKNTVNIELSGAGQEYTIVMNTAGTGSCTSSTGSLTKKILLIIADNCSGMVNNWTKSGGAANSPYCGVELNTGNSVAGGTITKTFSTIVGKTYYGSYSDNQGGTASSNTSFSVVSSTNASLVTGATGPGNAFKTFSFVATTTTSTMSITGTGATFNTDNHIMNVQMYTIN